MDDRKDSEVRAHKAPDGVLSISGPRGAAIVVNSRAGDVMRLQFAGHLIGRMMGITLDALEPIATHEVQFAIVIDAESQSGYEPEVRSLVTSWLLKHREKLRPAHLLSRAPMIKMWGRMLNLSLGREIFRIYEDRGDFERAVGHIVRDSERIRAARRA